MSSTLLTYASLLKRRYTTDKVADLTLKNRPFLARLPKSEDGSGDGENVPIIGANPQGTAGILSQAQTAKGNIVAKHFVLTYGDYSGAVDIGLKVLRASRNNAGAFIENKTAEIDGLHETFSDDIALMVAGNGGHALGRVAPAGVSGETVTLTDAADAANFEVGMYVEAATTDGSDTSQAGRTGYTYVTAVDRVGGVVTFEDLSDANIANDDYLFRYGMFQGTVSAVQRTYIMAGVGAFVASSETPATLYSLVRTSDPIRYAGCRVASGDLTGKGMAERIQLLCAIMGGRYHAKGPWEIYMHDEDWHRLSIALQSQGIRPLEDTSTSFGFQYIQLAAGQGMVKIFADPWFKKGTAFALNMSIWKLKSMGALIGPVDEDGLTIVRASTTNDFEYRLVSFPCLATNCPKNNGRVALY